MRPITLLKHYDRAFNTFGMGPPAYTRNILKGLRRNAKATDLKGYDELITQRLDDMIGVVDQVIHYTGERLSKANVREFQEDFIDQIRMVYHATGCPDFNYSDLLSRNRSYWTQPLTDRQAA